MFVFSEQLFDQTGPHISPGLPLTSPRKAKHTKQLLSACTESDGQEYSQNKYHNQKLPLKVDDDKLRKYVSF